jgi:hypothetical protein
LRIISKKTGIRNCYANGGGVWRSDYSPLVLVSHFGNRVVVVAVAVCDTVRVRKRHPAPASGPRALYYHPLSPCFGVDGSLADLGSFPCFARQFHGGPITILVVGYRKMTALNERN